MALLQLCCRQFHQVNLAYVGVSFDNHTMCFLVVAITVLAWSVCDSFSCNLHLHLLVTSSEIFIAPLLTWMLISFDTATLLGALFLYCGQASRFPRLCLSLQFLFLELLKAVYKLQGVVEVLSLQRDKLNLMHPLFIIHALTKNFLQRTVKSFEQLSCQHWFLPACSYLWRGS